MLPAATRGPAARACIGSPTKIAIVPAGGRALPCLCNVRFEAQVRYGMSTCALGFAGVLGGAGIGVNALWPRTAIATAAVRNLLGGEQAIVRSAKKA